MPLIQLSPHLFTSLPAHPSLPPNPSRPELSQFITTALREAISLLDTTIPSTLTADSKPRSSPPSHAKVKLLRGWRKPAGSDSNQARNGPGKGEFWVCRESQHVDSAASGTASWEEFEDGLRQDHAKHEMEYTPSVTGVERLLQWEGPELETELEVEGVMYTDFEVEGKSKLFSLQSDHTHLPPRRADRAALVLSLTISARTSNKLDTEQEQQQQQSPPGFVTIQIPLHPDASSTPTELHQKIHSTVPRRTIFANYASVERVMSRRSSTQDSSSPETTSSGHVQWTMATTSDAGGSIPQWVQRNWTLGGVPRAVVADVGLFIGWTDQRRKKRGTTGSS
ncbi:hypothetical protein N7474_003039 [Penicillium riverlandense]|uniref:uncharacterized protein n=1 Tax=Penicillium riverlandense TaxID=1903569 RepID=UPI0025484EDB|nr:uncharacterized protein N7474_003039 [Penicillium riverlandense]KAJ5825901.1 hypothetical protein N7474_003039 [Penicillium riverlandense]